MKKKNKDEFFGETYTVNLWGKNPRGFFERKVVDVTVEVHHGVNEKNNHERAFRMAEALYPGYKAMNVTYH